MNNYILTATKQNRAVYDRPFSMPFIAGYDNILKNTRIFNTKKDITTSYNTLFINKSAELKSVKEKCKETYQNIR